MVLTEGTKIDGRYIIEKLIGEGGMANVYLAKDIILNRDVAVKVLHEQLAKQERFIERFRREAEAVSSIVHPNVVEIYDVGQYDNCYFIIMELLEGETLKEYIKEKKFLSVSETISIMKQVSDGVGVAHEQGIVHRDLKPQNIFIQKDGVIKIMDFGIAYQQDASPLTQTNAVMGSVHYLSPEQAKGENATVQTDIYSLGIVMYEMLTGSVPYTGDSAVNIVLRHLRETVPYVTEKNEHVPQSVENIIIKATAKNPHDRYQNVTEMRHDLDTALNVERMNEPRIYLDPYEDEATEKEIELLEHSGEFADDALDEETAHRRFPFNLNRKKIIILISGVVATLLVLATTLLALSGGKTVLMPDVVNKPLEEATVILVEQGLELGNVEEVASDTIEVGNVVSTSVPANEQVAIGTAIDVKVSKGKILQLANYVGQDIELVKNELNSLGIKYKVEHREPINDEADGIILAQNPPAGQDFSLLADTLTLTVAQRESFELANLAGYSQSAASGYANENGLTLIPQYEYSDTVPAGTVIRIVDYWPGKKVKRGDAITVVISNGEDPNKKPVDPPVDNGDTNESNKPTTGRIQRFH